MDLLAELRGLAQAFTARGVAYALCGGMAMAVYGVPRATMDIDVIVMTSDLERAKQVARERGFILPAAPMEFGAGRVRIHRLSKPGLENQEVLPLDLLEADLLPPDVWESRREVLWEGGALVVVGRGGLTSLKMLRDSLQDKADIAALEQSS